MNIITSKNNFYKSLDAKAKELATKFTQKEEISASIMLEISKLYKAAKIEKEFENEQFEAAYHQPITSEFEFLISRMLYHFAQLSKFNWKVLLRRQRFKTAPDIRIENNGYTIAIIEIKIKAGWIQPFLSRDRYKTDLEKFQNGWSTYNPDDIINKSKNQLHKYAQAFNIKKEDIFFLLPTLKLVHKKKYTQTKINDYYHYFNKTSELPKENFILLSNNLNLDLSNCDDSSDYAPTNNFERMIDRLVELTNL